jgi:solute carrier family 35 (UDP-galactose transporter), member B1
MFVTSPVSPTHPHSLLPITNPYPSLLHRSPDGICQEGVYEFRSPTGEKYTATLFFLLVQCLANTLIAGLEMVVFGTTKNSPPITSYSYVGISYICAMLFSNEALKYVSYPTQALGKSCKMIPVMLFGFLIRGKVSRQSLFL